ncbi:hypothetical protein [Paenibacillus sp. GXUN7292]|uniref:hypothetical protein n=1 Tax=Paenibacillus sp. GXUN7292 TaxID=3422499 RepID=UPI003D7E4597
MMKYHVFLTRGSEGFRLMDCMLEEKDAMNGAAVRFSEIEIWRFKKAHPELADMCGECVVTNVIVDEGVGGIFLKEKH